MHFFKRGNKIGLTKRHPESDNGIKNLSSLGFVFLILFVILVIAVFNSFNYLDYSKISGLSVGDVEDSSDSSSSDSSSSDSSGDSPSSDSASSEDSSSSETPASDTSESNEDSSTAESDAQSADDSETEDTAENSAETDNSESEVSDNAPEEQEDSNENISDTTGSEDYMPVNITSSPGEAVNDSQENNTEITLNDSSIVSDISELNISNSSITEELQVINSITLMKEIPRIRIAKNNNFSMDLTEYFSGAEYYSIETLSEITIILNGSILTFFPAVDFKGSRILKITAYSGNESLESNEFTFFVSALNVKIETLREQIKLGEPVRWTKNITLESPENVILELPSQAEEVSVTPVDAAYGSSWITGQSILKQSSQNDILKSWWNSFMNFLSQLFRARITGYAAEEEIKISAGSEVSHDSEKVEVALDNNAENYIVEYTTPAPISFEENTSRGKKVIISGPDNLNYADVISFTSIAETLQVGEENQINVYWVENQSYVASDALDENSNGLLDYVEWITPHLSNQTFEITTDGNTSGMFNISSGCTNYFSSQEGYWNDSATWMPIGVPNETCDTATILHKVIVPTYYILANLTYINITGGTGNLVLNGTGPLYNQTTNLTYLDNGKISFTSIDVGSGSSNRVYWNGNINVVSNGEIFGMSTESPGVYTIFSFYGNLLGSGNLTLNSSHDYSTTASYFYMYGDNSGFDGTLNIYEMSTYSHTEPSIPRGIVNIQDVDYGGRYQVTAADGNVDGICPDIYVYPRGRVPSNRMIDPNGFIPSSHWTCLGGGGTIYLRGGTIPPGSSNLNTTLVVEAENSSLNGAFRLYGILKGNSTLNFYGYNPGIFRPDVSEFSGDLNFASTINPGSGSETYSFNSVDSVPAPTSKLFFDGRYRTGTLYPLYFYFDNPIDTNWTINNPIYIGESVTFYVETNPYKTNRLTINNTLQIGNAYNSVVTIPPVFISPLAFGPGASILMDVLHSSKYDNFTCSNETIDISLATLNITVNSSLMNSFNRRIILTGSNMTGQAFGAVNFIGNSTPASIIYYNRGINFTLEGLCPNGWDGAGVENDPCQITECNSINKANFYYRLQNNISATGNCFIINASNITFDGAGYTILGNSTSMAVLINYSNNAVVRNCFIKNVSQGIWIYNSENTLITQNIINYTVPVASGWTYFGIRGNNMSNSTISYNNISSDYNKLGEGIFIEESLNLLVLKNYLFDMRDGISMQQNNDYSRIVNNTISHLTRKCIALWNNRNSWVEGNNASLCGFEGLSILLQANNATVQYNNFYNNTNGIETSDDCYDATIRYNNITGNTAYGLKIEGQFDGMQLYGNSISDNAGAGIAFLFGVVQTNLSIYNNLFNNSINIYVSAGGVDSSSNKFNTTLSAGINIVRGRYIGGNYWTNASATGFSDSCMDYEGNGICDNPYNFSSGVFDYLPLAVPDFDAPLLAITYPANDSYTSNVSSFNYTYNDSHSGTCWYSRDNGASNSSSVAAGINFSGVISNEGTNNWRLYCADGAENLNSTSITFFKDSAPPSVTLSKSGSTTSSLIININAVDEGTGVASCNSSRGIISGITSVSDSGLECGTFYDYEVNCSDYMNFSDIGQISLSTDNCPESSGSSILSILPETIDLSKGHDGIILLGEILNFNLGSQKHSIFLQILTQNSATFKISSETQIVTLKIGEEKYLDLNGSGTNNFYIKLNNVSYRKAEITIKTLGGSAEIPGDGVTRYIPIFPMEKEDIPGRIYFYLAVIILVVALALLARIFLKKHRKHSKKQLK